MVETRRLTALTQLVETNAGSVPSSSIATISGGADSAVAAWLASRHGGTTAVHVDHGLPGSRLMRHAAEAIAARLGLELLIVEAQAKGDSEGELRRARYAALSAVGNPEQPLVLGHTADDQVETVVINLMRGSGVSGLGGMPRSRGRLLRPLLATWRTEVRELASLLEIPWRDDPANQDLRHLRNRIRLGLLPDIERRFNLDFRHTLLRTARSVQDAAELLSDSASSLPVERTDRGFRVALGAARAAGERIAALVLRRELMRLQSGFPPDRAVIERALEVLEGRRSSAQLGEGFVVRRERAFLVIGVDSVPTNVPPAPVPLGPGLLRWGRFRFEVGVTERAPVVPLSPWAAVIPLADSHLLRIRPVAYDEARSAGMARPSAAWPAVEADERLIWIPGVSRFRWENSRADRYLCAVVEEESNWARYEP